MAFTTWSTTDKSASMTLSGGNLIATASAVTVGVRAVHPKRTGKYYIEYLSTTTQSANSSFGFGTARTGLATGTGSCFVITASSGLNYLSDSFANQITGFGNQSAGITTSTLMCAAIDLDAGLIWFRMSAAGIWNNNAANNPATGVGGISLSGTGLGQGIDVYPFVWLGTTPNSVTANFGATAFTGAVPAGFTSGWDDSVGIVTNVVSTQTAAEQWGVGTPDMQLTQMLVEQWAEVTTVTPQFILTQALIEQWASVAEAASTTAQARAWIMA